MIHMPMHRTRPSDGGASSTGCLARDFTAGLQWRVRRRIESPPGLNAFAGLLPASLGCMVWWNRSHYLASQQILEATRAARAAYRTRPASAANSPRPRPAHKRQRPKVATPNVLPNLLGIRMSSYVLGIQITSLLHTLQSPGPKT